jgi:hypothetical protein
MKKKKQPLDPTPIRSFTDRECASIIGTLLGGLVQYSDLDTVRRAITWWAETEEAWAMLAMCWGIQLGPEELPQGPGAPRS